MRADVTDAQEGFSGGLNTIAEEATLAANEMRQAQNVRLTIEGSALKRAGTRNLSVARVDATEVPMRGFSWRQPASTLELVAVGGVTTGKLYTGTYGYGMAWTFIANLNNSSEFPQFAAFRDTGAECVYIAQSGLMKYKAGVLTRPAGTPANIRRLAVQNNRLFGITGVDQTLWYSNLNDGDSLGIDASSGGSQIIRTFSNQELTALAAVGDSLLIFHRTAISRFTGYGAGDISITSGTRGVTSDVGTVAPDSIVVVENVCYFLTDRGFYAATEEGVHAISEKIENTITNIDHLSSYQVQGVHGRKYREASWIFPGVGAYVYNYRLKAWSGPFVGAYQYLYTAWETIDSSGNPIVLIGSYNDGFVKRADCAEFVGGEIRDNISSAGVGGAAVVTVIKCHRMTCGSRESEKAFRFFYLQCDTGGGSSTTLTWDTNLSSYSLGSFLPTVAGTLERATQAWGRGYHIDVIITDSGVTYNSFERVVIAAFDYGNRY